jgi:hypothetical protein
MSHAKEPWYVVGAPWGDGTWINAGTPDPHHEGFVADCEDINGDIENDQSAANARRIVACVNACAGFSIEEIEGANFHKDLVAAQEEIDLLEKQRDSALAKLASMTIDRDSWEDQADARVKDWLEMKEQRDEILSELELIYSWSHNWNSEFMNDPEWKNVDETRIKALVARVKGNGLGAILNSEAIEHCRDGETT